ncbi:MAG: SRPBCC domain-containing protein [Bacteroidetes bacterium]|nr:MAG: SRPBCC domain-containing protein [Bacteroidota bacterium]
MPKPVGQTQSAGFQIGVRRTVAAEAGAVWDFLLSGEGLRIWLGDVETDFTLQMPFSTREGITGQLRVLKPYSHLRMAWKKPDWEMPSTLQIRVIGKPGKTTLSFHQEKLANAEQRADMKTYWTQVLQSLISAFG